MRPGAALGFAASGAALSPAGSRAALGRLLLKGSHAASGAALRVEARQQLEQLLAHRVQHLEQLRADNLLEYDRRRRLLGRGSQPRFAHAAQLCIAVLACSLAPRGGAL